MAGKLDLKSGVIAGGLTGVVLSLACAAAVYTFPYAAYAMFNSMIHSTIPVYLKPFELVSFVAGLIASFVIGAIIAGSFTAFYNKLSK